MSQHRKCTDPCYHVYRADDTYSYIAYVTLPEILNILQPQTGHVPDWAFLPFFMVMTCGSFISLLALHRMQYACTIIDSSFLPFYLVPPNIVPVLDEDRGSLFFGLATLRGKPMPARMPLLKSARSSFVKCLVIWASSSP